MEKLVDECTDQLLYKQVYSKELREQNHRAEEQAIIEKNNILMRKRGLVVELEEGQMLRGGRPVRPVKILDVVEYEQMVRELRWAEEKAQYAFEAHERAVAGALKAKKKERLRNHEREEIRRKM